MSALRNNIFFIELHSAVEDSAAAEIDEGGTKLEQEEAEIWNKISQPQDAETQMSDTEPTVKSLYSVHVIKPISCNPRAAHLHSHFMHFSGSSMQNIQYLVEPLIIKLYKRDVGLPALGNATWPLLDVTTCLFKAHVGLCFTDHVWP